MISSSFARKVYKRLDRLDMEMLRDFVHRLFEERDFFYMIFDSMAEGVVVTDEEHAIRYVNRTAEVLLSRKRDDILNKPVLDCIISVDFFNLVRSALMDNERIRNKEIGLYYPSDRILNVNVFPLLRKGDLYGNLILFMDITQKKKEQQRLRRAESLAALSTISAGIAHEIKNPLGAMDIHLQLMERALEKETGESKDLQRFLGTVREEVNRLNAIVTDFLSAIRPLKLTLTPICPNRVLEDLARLEQAELEARGIRLQLHPAEELPTIPLDFKFLRQALLNLVKNAAEALEQGGTIVLASRLESDAVVLTVEDNGPGIPQDIRNTIFEPYFTTKPAGTGLGLTIVYRIVKEHGGEISLDNSLEQGTRFTIRLPLSSKPSPMIDYHPQQEEDSVS